MNCIQFYPKIFYWVLQGSANFITYETARQFARAGKLVHRHAFNKKFNLNYT